MWMVDSVGSYEGRVGGLVRVYGRVEMGKPGWPPGHVGQPLITITIYSEPVIYCWIS